MVIFERSWAAVDDDFSGEDNGIARKRVDSKVHLHVRFGLPGHVLIRDSVQLTTHHARVDRLRIDRAQVSNSCALSH